jgi:hypothetical protein
VRQKWLCLVVSNFGARNDGTKTEIISGVYYIYSAEQGKAHSNLPISLNPQVLPFKAIFERAN